MTLVDKKVLESDRNAVYVKSTEGDRLVGTTEENKNVFDKYPELIRAKYNELIDLLIASGLDNIVDDLANRYTKDESNALVEAETKDLVADIGIDLVTGAITVTKKDGTSTTIDTALEKVPVVFEFETDEVADKYYLKIVNTDGTVSRTEVTNLMNQYTFQSSSTIMFAVSHDGTTTTVSAEILGKSITLAMLADEVSNFINQSVASVSANRTVVESAKVEVLNASKTVTDNLALSITAKDMAVQYGNLSQSYAVGGTNSRVGEDTDNSSYYARQAALYARQAENYKNEAGQIVGGDYVTNTQFNNTLLDYATKDYVDALMQVDESTGV